MFYIVIQAFNILVITIQLGPMKIQLVHNQQHIIWFQRKYIQLCWCRHTIWIKWTSSYPTMNSFLCTCSQLHLPIFYMHFFIQTTLIHRVRVKINIIISRENQNRDNLITKLIIHINDRCLIIDLPVIQCCIYTRNALPNIPNNMRFLCTIYLRPTTLILRAIYLVITLTTYSKFQPSDTITSIMLPSELWPLSLSSYV